jgi:glycyl-tRNA synthetase beta chain
MTDSLLIELFTEELPPKALARLGDAFAQGLFAGLGERDLLEPGATVTLSVALDASGEPTAPLAKKLAALARSVGAAEIDWQSLERASDGKAEAFFYRYTARGAELATGLQATLEETIAKLPIPKLMSYQRPDGSTVHFVRPAHSLIARFGAEILPVTLLGLQASNLTQGHRFLAHGAIEIRHANDYAQQLESAGHVVASYAERRERMRSALLQEAGADQVIMPESLLDEVNSLVEWPVVYACHFEEAFLAVPQECLILTMQTNQKYFALTDADGHLRNRFLIVSNLATDTPQSIITGNERVVRPQEDAGFARAAAGERGLPQQDRQPAGSRAAPAADCRPYRRWTRSRRRGHRQGRRDARRRTGQGRPAHRHGRRVPRAARHHGHLLRPP